MKKCSKPGLKSVLQLIPSITLYVTLPQLDTLQIVVGWKIKAYKF
jgi:hypothetical protein